MVDIEETGVEAVRPHTVLLVVAVAASACEAPQLAEVEEDVLTLTVAGDVTIDSIKPAFGNVVILDPSGRSIAQTTLVSGRYRLGQELSEGVDVCDGYAVFTEIIEETRRRTQSRQLASTTGDCLISNEAEVVHHVDLNFPMILGRPN